MKPDQQHKDCRSVLRIIKRVKPYLGKERRNVTSDRFFTSTHLATQLWKERCHLSGL